MTDISARKMGTDLSLICDCLKPEDRERMRTAIATGMLIKLIQSVSFSNNQWIVSLTTEAFPITMTQAEFTGFCLGVESTVIHAQQIVQAEYLAAA